MQRLYRAKDVCRHFSISRQTLYQWRQRGLFPKPERIIGKTLYWTQAQLNEVVPNEDSEVTTANEGEVLYG